MFKYFRESVYILVAVNTLNASWTRIKQYRMKSLNRQRCAGYSIAAVYVERICEEGDEIYFKR